MHPTTNESGIDELYDAVVLLNGEDGSIASVQMINGKALCCSIDKSLLSSYSSIFMMLLLSHDE